MTPERKAELRQVIKPKCVHELLDALDAAESRATGAEAQRDRLAEALREIAECRGPDCVLVARAALAEVEKP